MKRVALAALFVVVAALALSAGPLSPQRADAGWIYKWRGEGADAFFYSVSGTVETYVYVFAEDGKMQQPPGPPNVGSDGFMCIDVWDWSIEMPILSGCGGGPLAPGDFVVSKGLASASLDTVFEVCDWVSGACFPVGISLDWAPTGPVSRGNSHSHYHSPDYNYHSHFSGSSRPAVAVGVVSDGITNFTPGPSVDGWIGVAKSGEVMVD